MRFQSGLIKHGAGAGSAGMGVCDLTREAMIKHGLSGEEASANFWVIDQKGLITESRSGIQKHVKVFARKTDDDKDGEELLEVVKRVKPTGAVSGEA
jgi:malic enzyme